MAFDKDSHSANVPNKFCLWLLFCAWVNKSLVNAQKTAHEFDAYQINCWILSVPYCLPAFFLCVFLYFCLHFNFEEKKTIGFAHIRFKKVNRCDRFVQYRKYSAFKFRLRLRMQRSFNPFSKTNKWKFYSRIYHIKYSLSV